MSIDDSDAALKIVEAGRQRVIERLRDAFEHQVSAAADLGEIDPAALDALISQSADRAGASLWRISLAEGAANEYGITVAAALDHSAVSAAEQLVGPSEQPEPVPGWSKLPLTVGADPELPRPAVHDSPPAEMSAAPALSAVPAPAEPDADAVSDARWEQAAAEEQGADPLEELRFGGDALGADEPDETETTGFDEPEPVDAEPAYTEPAPAPAPAAVAPASDAPAPPVAADSSPQAIRIAAVHTGGIETLKSGDKDLELRLSDAGLDVIRRSSGVAIGRLEWAEVTDIELEAGRKRRRRKAQSIQVRTSRGQAAFELPGLTDEEAEAHLEPMLERLRTSGRLGES
jgi:hypothetical protein